VNAIRLIRQIKVSSNTKIAYVGDKYSARDLLFDVNNNAQLAKAICATYKVNYVSDASGISSLYQTVDF